jgi:alkanesulfonate monooxygenase SsuD/methylene tetrahydromethanopterin reductase-like flavin-dependent oxidoreductase (luciferase family)
MPAAVRFGALCLPDVPWDVLVERVARVERLGFDVAALPDHFVDWTNPPSPWFEGWTALTGLAATTSTIRLATCVTQIPFRNPAVFARQALTLDHISGGRLEIGLGTGLLGDPSYAMAGIDDWEPRERVERLAEYAEIVDRLLRDEVTTFAGHYYRTDGAIVNPRPVQMPRPPLTIGALGPVMLRHAARLADIWSTLSFKGSFDDQVAETRARNAAMDEACAEVDRGRGTLGRSYTMYDAGARPRGGTYACYESTARFEDMASRIIELGMDELVLYYPPDQRQLPVFERIATDILPRLRGAAA